MRSQFTDFNSSTELTCDFLNEKFLPQVYLKQEKLKQWRECIKMNKIRSMWDIRNAKKFSKKSNKQSASFLRNNEMLLVFSYFSYKSRRQQTGIINHRKLSRRRNTTSRTMRKDKIPFVVGMTKYHCEIQ